MTTENNAAPKKNIATVRTGTERAVADNVIPIGKPAAGDLLGLGSIISLLLLFGAWCIVGIAYICVPGSIASAALGVVCAFMTLGSGLASVALCLGCAIGCLGLSYPVFVGARALQNALLKKASPAFNKKLLVTFAVIALIGAALAGIGTLADGGTGLALPGFLQAVFAA